MDAISSGLSANAGSVNGIYALKKAINLEGAAALQLIASVPEVQPATYSNPPNLGQNVDTTA